jgi:hypothetical protein
LCFWRTLRSSTFSLLREGEVGKEEVERKKEGERRVGKGEEEGS